jgi:pimeloyl-ACP methyl ester carboxylesterase
MLARAHDGAEIYFETYGQGPAVFLYNADPKPPPIHEKLGAAELTRSLVEGLKRGLADRYTLILPSYPGRPMTTMTPTHVTQDLLAIADAAGVQEFAWWGHSWGAVIGLQLALETDRLTALAMSGFPPLKGPYAEMLRLARVMADVGLPYMGVHLDSEARAMFKPTVTYYEGLQDFDDEVANKSLTLPRMTFIGSDDRPDIGDRPVDLGQIVASTQDELEGLGWEVHILDGLDHVTALQPDVLVPLLSEWLDRTLPKARVA